MKRMIKAVLFDVIGTTVTEDGGRIILDSLNMAFSLHGITVDQKLLHSMRGKDKKQLIFDVLSQQDCSLSLLDSIHREFKQQFQNNINSFSENVHTGWIFRYIKEQGMMLGIGTGLPADLFMSIYNHLGWSTHPFDYIGISEQLGKSRPDPVMIFDMMKRLEISPGYFLKVGDTVADIQEGKNAGVRTAVILSHTQAETILREQQPDYLITSLGELKTILDRQ